MDKQSILKIIADNKPLFDEVKSIIENEFNALPKEELNLSDKQLGERIRAKITGLETVKKAFDKILTFKTYEEKPKINNPGK